jgi:hypothetical protein
MNRDTVIGLLRGTPPAPGAVRQVVVPAAARSRSTLSRVD